MILKDKDNKIYMKGEKMLKILETIKELGEDSSTLLEAFIRLGHRATIRGLDYEMGKINKRKIKERIRKEKLSYYRNFICRLKRDGLIRERADEKKGRFVLTKQGDEKVIELKEKIKVGLPDKKYDVKSSERFTLVIFDIPEVDRRKRDWIRDVLRNMKFNMVQKSVWIGKVIIPKEFINCLFKMRMLGYVEIFEISKTGSLKKVV